MHAEVRVKYFFCVKISTRMLIRLWKSVLHGQLTSSPSTLFSSLHHLCAILFFHTHLTSKKFPDIRKPSRGKISSHESRGRAFLLLFLNCCFSTTGPDAPSITLRRPSETHLAR